MKVFLTGGTGFIGRPLVQSLLRRGWEVLVLARRPASPAAQSVQALGASLLAGDITDRESLRSGMQGADIVINNAAWYEYGLPRQARDAMVASNVQGAENVLGLAVALGVPRIVHVSSIVAHGITGPEPVDETFQRQHPPVTLYETTKMEAHQIAVRYQQEGAPLMIASPGSVIGPGDHATLGYCSRMYVRGFGMPMLAKGSASFIHVEDCAEGIALIAEKGQPGEEYFLTAGTLSYREMFDVWKSVPGGPKFMIWLPRGIGDIISASSEPLQRLLGLPNIISREVFLNGSQRWHYSGEKAARKLGLQTRDPRQAWRDTLEGERQRAAAGKGWRDTL